MASVAIMGMQFGDEAKSKIIGTALEKRDYFFGSHGRVVVARYQGGANAGHTQYIYGKPFVFHVIPSGIFAEDTYNITLAGTIFDPNKLMEEIMNIQKSGREVTPSNFGISNRCHLTFDYHYALERQEKKHRGGSISPTNRAILPTYVDTAARRGINFAEFLNPSSFSQLL